MRVLSLSAWDQDLAIGTGGSPKKNWVTLVTGPNGSKKSLLLRMLSSASLGYARTVIGDHTPIPVGMHSDSAGMPSVVIAIAGTAFDRFSLRSAYSLDKVPTSRSARSNYFYFGSKASNGAMSAVHSVRLIGQALLRNRHVLPERATSLAAVLDFLSLPTDVTVRLRRASRLNSGAKDADKNKPARGEFYPDRLDAALKDAQEKAGEGRDPAIDAYFTDLRGDRGRVDALKKYLERFPVNVDFDLRAGTCAMPGGLSEFDVEILIKTGLVNIGDIRFESAQEDARSIPAGDLSSGQWQILLGMFGVALEAQTDALIIIDEPENSLHPEWQREYVPLLETVLEPVQSCHVVIATHSPLIVSGITRKRGNIIQLVPSPDSRLGIESKPLEPTYGWDARHVLEALFAMDTTRAVKFVEASDRALALVRDDKTKTDEFRKLVDEINDAAQTLPGDDPMRVIVRALNNVAGPKVGSNG
jgi:energy-coupling factor transporter ATP-binding protein EcfA2